MIQSIHTILLSNDSIFLQQIVYLYLLDFYLQNELNLVLYVWIEINNAKLYEKKKIHKFSKLKYEERKK